jgi:isoleucyl-tRNA synthetase
MKTDYKNTLNLPNTVFPMKANLAKKELETLDYWGKQEIYRKIQEKDKSKAYILHDGPPYANGHIHLGHALNKILKDLIVKYKTMKGLYSPFIPGWDCHGLPIEHEVDKKLGSKKGEVSIIEKRKLCREYALSFLDIQREEFKRLGVFGDWAEPYITMSFSYEASIVREFGKFVEKGYVYKGKKPVHWCPVCVTALAEAEVEYADKESPSIYVKFEVEAGELEKRFPNLSLNNKRIFIIIWTTTPWTLPANLAIALHPDYEYSLILGAKEGYILATHFLSTNLPDKLGLDAKNYETVKTFRFKDIDGLKAKHPFIQKNSIILPAEHVTLEAGTGCVHTAPGHGQEDYEVGVECNLEIYSPVDDYGKFTEDVPEFKGQYVFKANIGIIELLKNNQALLHEEKVSHSYPHCWRCKKPVIFRATEQWFISMAHNELRQKSLREINKTKWVPSWGKERLYGMVENRPDWCISRQRAWGVPITLFKCRKCNEIIIDKAVNDKIAAEVEKSSADIWFEKSEAELLPKGYKCKKCSSEEFIKETDILDVWFDSGVSHAAVMETDKRLSWPADLYLEGSDQHRGWFQSSLLTSVGTRDKAPYKTVLTHGFVVDGQGKKMSKSIGNVISPQEVTDKHGAEILRLWSASADYREDMRISKEILDRLVEAYRKIRNTCRFLLGNLYDFDVSRMGDYESAFKGKSQLLEMDRLALSMLQGLIEKVSNAYENFEFHEVFHAIYNFCVINMSSFYFDVLKDRLYTFKAGSEERMASQWALYKILVSLTKMMAPVLSFTAEEIWSFIPGNKKESVFLAGFPDMEPEFLNKDLEKKWADLLKIRDEVNKALEIKRQGKFIGNSLEAKVNIYTDEEGYEILADYASFLPAFFIVSAVELFKNTKPLGIDTEASGQEESYKSPEINNMAIMVKKAPGQKCSRCWNWSESVGMNKDFDELCGRCCEVLTR